MENIWILAQAPTSNAPTGVTSEPVGAQEQPTTSTAQKDSSNTGQKGPAQQPFSSYNWVFILLMVVMVFMLFSVPRKQKQQRKKLEQSVEKNDKVLTIGGIIGTIVDIRDDEITLKVDESNNTKIKVLRSAIGRNLSKDKS
jgi:preprotein translocase subunit YajC